MVVLLPSQFYKSVKEAWCIFLFFFGLNCIFEVLLGVQDLPAEITPVRPELVRTSVGK